MQALWLLLLLIITAIYLLIVASSKQQWLMVTEKSKSALNSISWLDSKAKNKENIFLKYLGIVLLNLFPKKQLESIKHKYSFINRDMMSFSNDLGLLTIAIIIFCCTAVFSHNYYFLLIAGLLPVLLYIELECSVKNTEALIENNLDHIIRCLKILVIKSETPINTALELISRDLNDELKPVRNEINKIIERSKKSGIKKTLSEWDSKLPKFQDFISLLLSIHEGASKNAIKDNIDKFLIKYIQEKNEKVKAEVENLQLYLMLPIVVMLLVSMIPMIDAINFYMQKTGVL